MPTSSKWCEKDYPEVSKEDRHHIRKLGMAAYITLSAIVIDEPKREVILRAHTIIDGTLDEHGIRARQER